LALTPQLAQPVFNNVTAAVELDEHVPFGEVLLHRQTLGQPGMVLADEANIGVRNDDFTRSAHGCVAAVAYGRIDLAGNQPIVEPADVYLDDFEFDARRS
jgi:hypothetical protein